MLPDKTRSSSSHADMKPKTEDSEEGGLIHGQIPKDRKWTKLAGLYIPRWLDWSKGRQMHGIVLNSSD